MQRNFAHAERCQRCNKLLGRYGDGWAVPTPNEGAPTRPLYPEAMEPQAVPAVASSTVPVGRPIELQPVVEMHSVVMRPADLTQPRRNASFADKCRRAFPLCMGCLFCGFCCGDETE